MGHKTLFQFLRPLCYGPEDGLPPPCSPRLLLDDKTQTPPTVELQVLEMTFVEASEKTAEIVSLFSAAACGDVAKAGQC